MAWTCWLGSAMPSYSNRWIGCSPMLPNISWLFPNARSPTTRSGSSTKRTRLTLSGWSGNSFQGDKPPSSIRSGLPLMLRQLYCMWTSLVRWRTKEIFQLALWCMKGMFKSGTPCKMSCLRLPSLSFRIRRWEISWYVLRKRLESRCQTWKNKWIKKTWRKSPCARDPQRETLRTSDECVDELMRWIIGKNIEMGGE